MKRSDWIHRSFWFVYLLFVCAAMVAANVGCDQLREQPAPPTQPSAASPIPPVPQMPRDVPPGSKVTFVETYEGGSTSESGKGTGSGYSTSGDKAAANVDTTAPTVGLSSGGGASGGAARAILSAQITDNTIKLACLIIGLLLAGGGVVGWKYLHQRMFLGVSAFGVGVLMLALVPWPIAALVCLVAIGGALWYAFRDTAKFREGLRAVAAGVDSLPQMQRQMAKEEIGKHADESDKATIKQIKRDDDLTN